ncbi:MAG: hypothetical protein FWD47_15200 [Treponema sp.]|nr:hypothetical protein [Treponema sp.]
MKRKKFGFKYYLLLIYLLLFNVIIFSNENANSILIIDSDISLFKIGDNISYLNPGYIGLPLQLVDPNNFMPYFFVNSNGIIFRVCYNRSYIVRAIFVGVPKYLMLGDLIQGDLFKTPEGVFLGMTYFELLELIPNIRLNKINNWAYEAILPSGWKIAFVTGIGVVNYPTPGNRISIIYKN